MERKGIKIDLHNMTFVPVFSNKAYSGQAHRCLVRHEVRLEHSVCFRVLSLTLEYYTYKQSF